MMTFFFRYIVPKIIREQFYFRDIAVIRGRYSLASLQDPEVNAERLRAQMEAVEYWRI